jgi:phosphatidate phosphatase APP1
VEINGMIARAVHSVERVFDWFKYRLLGGFQSGKSLLIVPYLGYGSDGFIKMKGRVLEDTGIRPSKETDRTWDNLLNMYRRFESDEVPHARLRARFRGEEKEFSADEEGFFEVSFQFEKHQRFEGGWITVLLELLDPLNQEDEPVIATGRVMVVSPQARFGVISDIDDTVIHTGVTRRLKLAGTILLKNAYTRRPLKGVVDFYRALWQSGSKGSNNPLFYVSSSPWNMYDLFREFFQINQFPDGPVFLRDWGFERQSMLAVNNRDYKLEMISKILDCFPDLDFILIGDSGEEDPEIYTQIVQTYAQRILGVYIRDVRQDKTRAAEIEQLAAQVENSGSVLLLADDAFKMARHASEIGWIDSGSVAQPIK